VGAIVLFTIAIIFLPDIFDGKKQSKRNDFSSIPSKPAVAVIPASDTTENAKTSSKDNRLVTEKVIEQSSGSAETSNKSVALPVVKTSKPVTKSQTKKPVITVKKSKTTTIGKSWVITMGTFSQPDNVKPFLKKLRAKGFTAFSIPNNPIAGQITKVYVGPAIDKAALVKLQPKLKKAFKESGFITRYDPLQR
ncbi:MAG: SPOR domain-containing protein, partial [Psychrobium sp.]|nr:SPOR domain-containing protein [Psychrobium sp.]